MILSVKLELIYLEKFFNQDLTHPRGALGVVIRVVIRVVRGLGLINGRFKQLRYMMGFVNGRFGYDISHIW